MDFIPKHSVSGKFILVDKNQKGPSSLKHERAQQVSMLICQLEYFIVDQSVGLIDSVTDQQPVIHVVNQWE